VRSGGKAIERLRMGKVGMVTPKVEEV